jgi:glycosyltransferase involved in cell wall biosynthesis
MKTVSIILPCYNEEEALPRYFDAVDKVLPSIHDYQVNFILVNDGSKDKTLEVMNSLYQQRTDVTVCSLSRNFGQNAAFTAGLEVSKGDYCIMMDSDLQDPVTLIPEILEKFSQGYDVVNAHRADRSSDTAFKRDTAGLFYKIINKLEGKKVIPENVNCFRGISRKVVDKILALSEKDRCLLSEVPLIGYKTVYIDFTRDKRTAGKSKYSFRKLVRYALDNMSNITSRPLYAPAVFGGFMFVLSFLFSIVMTVLYILSYPSIHVIPAHEVYMVLLIIGVLFIGIGFLSCMIGILGIYLHNILINTRNRPNHIIDFVLSPSDKGEKND